MLVVRTDGDGRIAFGAMQAGLEVTYGVDDIDVAWCGFGEMGDAKGDGCAELQDDGSIQIEPACRNGDETVPRAVPAASSAAC